MAKIKCDKCGYEWETSSLLGYVSCPNCMQKVENKSLRIKKNGDRIER
jgi:DNA-directed RNA polymerase subunit RPC12/RpoP